MQLKMFSVRDAKGEIFNPPYFNKTHGEAERNFKELISDPKSMPGKYPEDYDLYYLGTYDDVSGTMVALDTPYHMVKGVTILNRQ